MRPQRSPHDTTLNAERRTEQIATCPEALRVGSLRSFALCVRSFAHGQAGSGARYSRTPDFAYSLNFRTRSREGRELVDPIGKTIEVYVLDDGDYHLIGYYGSDETARSALFDVEIALEKAFEDFVW